jgi:hypothetical protein
MMMRFELQQRLPLLMYTWPLAPPFFSQFEPYLQPCWKPPTRAFRTVHASKYWANLGLDDIYHTFAAAVLEVNGISPHQVLIEAHIDNFAHQDAGDAIAAVAAKFPESDAFDLAGSP